MVLSILHRHYAGMLALEGAEVDENGAARILGTKPFPAGKVLRQARKLGPDTSAAKLHDYLVNLRGWVGVNGTYDFRANPQRGLGQNNVIMVKFTSSGNVAASKFGGVPLR